MADVEELLDRLKAGDRHALTELFSSYRERLWRMVHFRLDQRLAGRVDADDVLQEAYLDAAGRVSDYLDKQTGSFFIWLRLVTMQTLVDVHRRHLRQKRDASRDFSIHGARWPQASSVSIADLLVGPVTSPSHVAWRAELSVQLEQTIASMELIDQEVLALRHFEELTNSEVAETLGIEPKAASIRYVRALKRLRGVLIEIFPEFDGEVPF